MYYLEKKIVVPASLDVCWEFFSSPKNLAKITPDHMGFEITSPNSIDQMYEGMLISYNVRPLLGIKMKWVSEITKIDKGKLFIDEQRVGPYGMWHHEHHFEEVENGVLMTDKIFYSLPLGFLGNIAHGLFVKKQLEGIFNYREEKVKELFG
jgi:ligand-binding SRPBCC domain-containing protein